MKFLARRPARNRSDGRIDFHGARERLGERTKWGAALKQHLPSADAVSGLLSNPVGHATVLASVHVSCAYYYTIISATQPALITTLAAALASDVKSAVAPAELDREHSSIQRTGQACIEAAAYMLQTCYEAHISSALLANMCVIK